MRAVLVIAIALALGCRDESLARLEAIRDEVCACETAACGEDAMSRVPQEQVEPTPRSQKVAREMLDCLSRLYSEPSIDPGPDADTGALDEAEPRELKRHDTD